MSVIIAELDDRKVWTGNLVEVPETQGAPKGWVFVTTPIPDSGPTEYVQWSPRGWQVLPEYPAPSKDEYAEEIKRRTAEFVQGYLDQEGFTTIEEFIKSYQYNDLRWIAQLVDEWYGDVYTRVRHHLVEEEVTPSDYSFIDTLPAGDEASILDRVPFQVTRQQARRRLVQISSPGDDKLAQIETFIASIVDDQERTEAEILWNESTTIQRNNPLVPAIGVAIGFDSTQLDTLFKEAVRL